MKDRDLTEDEKAFLESKLARRYDVEIQDDDDGYTITKREPVIEKRRNIFKSMYLWIGVVMTIPVMLLALLAATVNRVAAMFGGTEVLDSLHEEGLPDGTEELLAQLGIDWFPQFLELYSNRWFIAAGIVTVFLVIAGIMLMIELLRKKD